MSSRPRRFSRSPEHIRQSLEAVDELLDQIQADSFALEPKPHPTRSAKGRREAQKSRSRKSSIESVPTLSGGPYQTPERVNGGPDALPVTSAAESIGKGMSSKDSSELAAHLHSLARGHFSTPQPVLQSTSPSDGVRRSPEQLKGALEHVGDMLDQIELPFAATTFSANSPAATSYELTIDGRILKSPQSGAAACSPALNAPLVAIGCPTSPFNESSPFDAALGMALSHAALVSSELQCAIARADGQKSNLYAAAQLRTELANAVALLDQLESGDTAMSTTNLQSPAVSSNRSSPAARAMSPEKTSLRTPNRSVDPVGERALAAARERQSQRSESAQRSPSKK